LYIDFVDTTARLRERPLQLIARAMGGPSAARKKSRRLRAALAAWLDGDGLDQRLERLRALGYIERVPSRLQLLLGAADMMRFWLVPASEDYYQQKGIDFRFHQLLRFLDDPASLVDPIGLLSQPDVIVGHLMQVVHANPRYDLELLESWPDGLERLQSELEQMLAGTHPRAASIGAIVEEPDYHQRLYHYVLAYRRDHQAPAPLRVNVAQGKFADVERQFGSLQSAFQYFSRLPDDWVGALLHLVRVRSFTCSGSPSG
jgi:hypothetical protein